MSRRDRGFFSGSFTLLVIVLVVGYSLYGGLFLGSLAVHDAVAREDASSARPLALQDRTIDSVARFDFAPDDAGLDYAYNGSMEGNYMDALSNAGVYAGDYDADGWPDLLAVGGEQPILYENANGTFEPSGALPSFDVKILAATFLDHDRDGDLDLLMLAEDTPPILLENDDGTFRRTGTFEEALRYPFGAAATDYNDDGHLDLFVYQYGDFSDGLPLGFGNRSAPINADNGNPNVLYRGTESGFERVDAPAINGSRWSLAASFLDLTGDGRPDIHVANDFNHDVLYANRGNGSFERIILPQTTDRNGMSSEIADVNTDARPDVFVTNIYWPDVLAEELAEDGNRSQILGNYVLLNEGNGSFTPEGQRLGINTGGWGWASVIADIDNDADQDLVHTTSTFTFTRSPFTLLLTEEEREDLRELPYYQYPAVWARDRDGAFQMVAPSASGLDKHNGRGLARLDYDRDGDLDLAVATAGDYRLYKNRIETRNAIQLRVLGPEGSPAGAYGATVQVNTTHSQTRWVHARSDYLSQDSRVVHVGIGNKTSAEVTVRWPDGTTLQLENVSADQRLVVAPDGVRETISLSGE